MKPAPSSQLLFNECLHRGYQPRWLTAYGLFCFEIQGNEVFVYQTKNAGNSQLGTWLTTDKHATHVFLEHHGFPHIPFLYTTQRSELNAFFDACAPLVAKPVTGERSQGVQLIRDRSELQALPLTKTLFEKFIAGVEYRYCLIDGQVVAGQEKRLNPSETHPWRKIYRNLTRSEWNPELVEMAQQIYRKMPQALLAVDFLRDEDQKALVLELNSMPGLWSFLHPDEGESIDLSPLVLDLIIRTSSETSFWR